YRSYRRGARRRAARQTHRQLLRLTPRFLREQQLVRAAEGARFARVGAWNADVLSDAMPVQFNASVGKGAYFFAAARRAGPGALVGVVLAAGVGWLYRRVIGEPLPADASVVPADLLTQPVVALALLVVGYSFIRQVLFRLDDQDVEREGSS